MGERSKVIPAEDWKDILGNHERKPLEELNALADDEEMIDQGLDEKEHPINPVGEEVGGGGAAGLIEQLTGGDKIRSTSLDYSIENEDVNEYNSDEDLDKLLDEEIDALDIE